MRIYQSKKINLIRRVNYKFKQFLKNKKLINSKLFIIFSSSLIFSAGLIPIESTFIAKAPFKNLLKNGLDNIMPVSFSRSINGWIEYGGSFFSVTKNYLLANINNKSPDLILLKIKQLDYLKLTDKRNEALKNKILVRSHNDEVKAKLDYKNNNYSAKIRLKGDWTDHLKGDQWSYRVKVRNKKSIKSMREFSLQHPVTRNYIYEYLIQKLYKYEGLPSIRYDFVNLNLNGNNLGIYAIEEHFDKILIENNGFREGPILRLSENDLWSNRKREISFYGKNLNQTTNFGLDSSPVDTFNPKNIKLDQNKRSQYLFAKELLNKYLNGESKASEVFDLDMLAKYFAINDIFSSHHGAIWHNIRFYFNPITSRLIPIGFDAQPPFKGNPNLEGGNRITVDYNPFKFFNNTQFLELYTYHLERLSKKEYLNLFLQKHKNEIENSILFLQKSYPFVRVSLENLENSQIYIQNRLNPIEPLSANSYFLSDDQKELTLELTNKTLFPIEIISFRLDGKTYIPKNTNLVDKKNQFRRINYKTYKLKLANQEINNFLSKRQKNKEDNIIKYKILGLSKEYSQRLKVYLARKYLDEYKSISSRKPNSNEFPYLIHDHKKKIINMKEGDWKLDKILITPENYTLNIKGDIEIDIANKAMIISQGPLNIVGNKNKSILMKSQEGGNGLIVLNAKKQSNFKYVKFKNLSAVKSPYLNITGAINFYNSPINIEETIFENTLSEDALNIFRSSFFIKNTKFQNVKSDALDIDFSNGIIINSDFNNIGNDAVDVSGSRVEINGISIFNTSDKALSAGERSVVYINDSKIANAGIGLASKDLSEIISKNTILESIDLCLAAYQKKPEYGFGYIYTNKKHTLCKTEYLLEPNSTIVVEETSKIPNTNNVSNLLYGNEYGKASER